MDGAQGKNKPEESKGEKLFQEPEEFKQDDNKEKLAEDATENPTGRRRYFAAYVLTISINTNYFPQATLNDQSCKHTIRMCEHIY